MANKIIDFNESQIKKYVEALRPKDLKIREEIDIDYSYDGKTIELFEITPSWRNPSEKERMPFAKMRYYKSRKEWNLYWMKANANWELYEPFPESTHLDEIFEVIKEDKNCCFFG